MKFLPSSSSTLSITPTLCNSKSATATAASGCLTGMFRRIFCSGTLVESEKHVNVKDEENTEDVTRPGIVARLMGLNSMPDVNFTPRTFSRSRSLNSVDYGAETDSIQCRHRRIRTAMSFREAPVFFELENEEFLLLSFDNGCEVRSEVGFQELKRKRGNKCSNSCRREKVVENVEEKRTRRYADENSGEVRDLNSILVPVEDSYTTSRVELEAVKFWIPESYKEFSDKAQLRRRKKKKQRKKRNVKKVEPESDSENSSPVSVLEFAEFIIDHEVPTLGRHLSSTVSNSRRKLSTELDTYEGSLHCNADTLISEDQEQKTINGSAKRENSKENSLDLWFEICRLTREDIIESKWIYREHIEDSDEIGIEFGLQIIDQLLNELVSQLAGLLVRNFDS